MYLSKFDRKLRSEVLQQQNWSEIYQKFINRSTSVWNFICQEVNPLLGFEVSESSFRKYIRDYVQCVRRKNNKDNGKKSKDVEMRKTKETWII